MTDGNVSTQSRWVTRALWTVAALLAAMILTVRSRGLVTTAELAMDIHRPNAAAAFAVPVAEHAGLQSFDSIGSPGHAPVAVVAGRPAQVTQGALVTLRGWAYDRAANATFGAIGARVDRLPAVWSALIDIPRPDVASALHAPRAERSGFALDISTVGLAPGRHVVAVRGLEPGGRTALALGSPIAFDVVASADAAQHTDSIDALNGVVVNAAASATAPVVILRSYAKLTVYGWGLITTGARLASTAAILVDGNPAATASYGLARPDVGAAYHDVRLARSGIAGTLSTQTLTPGLHLIRFQLIANDGSTVDSASVLHVDVQ